MGRKGLDTDLRAFRSGFGVWATMVRAFARMPTLGAMKLRRRWGTRFQMLATRPPTVTFLCCVLRWW
jgi:hypothetical protein